MALHRVAYVAACVARMRFARVCVCSRLCGSNATVCTELSAAARIHRSSMHTEAAWEIPGIHQSDLCFSYLCIIPGCVRYPRQDFATSSISVSRDHRCVTTTMEIEKSTRHRWHFVFVRTIRNFCNYANFTVRSSTFQWIDEHFEITISVFKTRCNWISGKFSVPTRKGKASGRREFD